MDKESNSTLQDMILLEKSTEDKKNLIAVDALMWLRRYLNICLCKFFKDAYLCIFM